MRQSERIHSEENHGVVANLAKIVANVYKDAACSLKSAWAGQI